MYCYFITAERIHTDDTNDNTNDDSGWSTSATVGLVVGGILIISGIAIVISSCVYLCYLIGKKSKNRKPAVTQPHILTYVPSNTGYTPVPPSDHHAVLTTEYASADSMKIPSSGVKLHGISLPSTVSSNTSIPINEDSTQ